MSSESSEPARRPRTCTPSNRRRTTIPLTDNFIDRYQDRSPEWGFNGLGWVIYKRTYARPVYRDGKLVRTEDWHETVRRVVDGANAIGAGLLPWEQERLFDYIWNLKGNVAGRMLWQLGTENNERLGGDSLVNCWFVDISDVTDFGWMFERLMLGGGVGFSVTQPGSLGTVRQGRVVHEEGAHDSDFIVPDKREGWADLLMRVIRCYLPVRETDYNEFTYSTVLVRPEGAPIKTFGGVASGPGILVEGVEKICAILDGAVGRKLTSVEVLDIANVIGSIVVSGNVRRSAQIALGNSNDLDYLKAKDWSSGSIPSYRAMSNNSVYVDDIDSLPEDFWENYKGGSEPYGIVNLPSAVAFGRMGEYDPDYSISGFNPCAEIPLADRESCNLSEVYLPNIGTKEELWDVVKLLYKVQKAVAAMPYLDEDSDAITSENMRLGLGVTGYLQATEEQKSWLPETYERLRRYDRRWSSLKGWPESVRLTTVKPSGTLSLLAGVTPGGHPGFSRFHIRRVRLAANDPLAAWCQHKGYRWEFNRDFDGNEDPRTVVVEFPAEFPEGTVFAEDMSAIDQMEVVRRLQSEWADNAVSVTVYYEPEELDAIREYLRENWDQFKSLSFLLRQNHGFDQAPLEEIDEEEYRKMLDRIVEDDVDLHAGESTIHDEECATGACPIR